MHLRGLRRERRTARRGLNDGGRGAPNRLPRVAASRQAYFSAALDYFPMAPTMDTERDAAKVLFFPPGIPALAILIGAGLQWLWPLTEGYEL
ncbi:MAG TPA: hypothetical protein VMW48_20710, partial [Vicinamibacterales bacterium]|nr:hypothetical protein [Vicinamibacterales bacterium]